MEPDGTRPLYFAERIPRQIHQVWFGGTKSWDQRKDRHERERSTQWRLYGDTFSYSYRLWTDKDVDELSAMMPAALQPLFVAAHQQAQWRLASDIARVAILYQLGGYYFDCDMAPPRSGGSELALDDVFPGQGLVLMTERSHRAIGTSAIFVANGLILASPRHPVLGHLLNQIPSNALAVHKDRRALRDPIFVAGCMALNKALAGTFYVVSLDDLVDLGVVHEVRSHWLAER